MITSLDLYLINAVIEFATTLNVVSCICFFIFGFVWLVLRISELVVESDHCIGNEKTLLSISKFRNTSKKIAFISLLIGLSLAFVPDRKTAIEIYLIPKIINNQSLQKLPEDIHQWISKQIKEDIKDK